MTWEVFRRTADEWCAVEFLNEHVYARASRHRSEVAAQKRVDRLNHGRPVQPSARCRGWPDGCPKCGLKSEVAG